MVLNLLELQKLKKMVDGKSLSDMRKNTHDTPQIPTKRQTVKKGANKHS